MHATVRCATEAPGPYVADLRTREIDGNHWVVAQRPDLVVGHFVEFVEALGSEARVAN